VAQVSVMEALRVELTRGAETCARTGSGSVVCRGQRPEPEPGAVYLANVLRWFNPYRNQVPVMKVAQKFVSIL
jgi:hypothetical protein